MLSACLAAQHAAGPELTARELFYSAVPASSSSTTPAHPKSRAKTATVHKSAPAARPQPATVALPADGGQIIRASATPPERTTAPAPSAGSALGLKYTILKLSDDEMAPVAPDTVFHAGDKIQFKVEANGPGYLYIISQGSSGTWKPMFPSPEIVEGSNRVEALTPYTFPQGYRFVFDQQPGDERIFIILSRNAKPDFEQLVYSLKGGAKPATNLAPQPAPMAKPVMVAEIRDDAINRLRTTYARDLVIEKVGDSAQNDSPEKAVYVVNPTGSADSCVVADLRLIHR
jgi:hypothetical protein